MQPLLHLVGATSLLTSKAAQRERASVTAMGDTTTRVVMVEVEVVGVLEVEEGVEEAFEGAVGSKGSGIDLNFKFNISERSSAIA